MDRTCCCCCGGSLNFSHLTNSLLIFDADQICATEAFLEVFQFVIGRLRREKLSWFPIRDDKNVWARLVLKHSLNFEIFIYFLQESVWKPELNLYGGPSIFMSLWKYFWWGAVSGKTLEMNMIRHAESNPHYRCSLFLLKSQCNRDR